MGQYRICTPDQKLPEYFVEPTVLPGHWRSPEGEQYYTLSVGDLRVALTPGERKAVVDTWDRIDGMPLNAVGWAVKQMWNGARVQRAGWNGKGMWLALQVPDANSKMGLPYVYMRTVTGQLVPWLCSQTDLLATDWQLAE